MTSGRGVSMLPLLGRGSGRPPDRAYVLLLGTCVAVYLLATGVILTYLAFFHYPQLQYDEVRPLYHIPTHILGPFLVATGSVIMLCIIIVACIFGCEQKSNNKSWRPCFGNDDHSDTETEVLKASLIATEE